MKALRWDEARDCVRRLVADTIPTRIETLPLIQAHGRVLAKNIAADRDYPPFIRSVRDGFALRRADLPGPIRIVGETRAGEPANRAIQKGECIEIMTGAPVPPGADAVLMVEHAQRDGETMTSDRSLTTGENIAPAGSEASATQDVLSAGIRLDYAHVAVLATVGVDSVPVYAHPSVSIIATGDELVPVHQQPREYQIRNSNSFALTAQVRRAGGQVAVATVAPDTSGALHEAIERAFQSDLVLFSGGVSAGKYDLVETVLAEYKAEFFFTRVLIQPGQPAVFGRAHGKFFFGLPGNPVSTMVTFELFARLALELLSGDRESFLPFSRASLAAPFRHKTGLTRFLPAKVTADGDSVVPVPWQGSGDVFAVARANAFLVADADRESWATGDSIRVLLR